MDVWVRYIEVKFGFSKNLGFIVYGWYLSYRNDLVCWGGEESRFRFELWEMFVEVIEVKGRENWERNG